ncbi:hypothetical protein JQK19_12125 [Chromobacterium violaceum]|uniref:hypothetical protein n=1 Tax=Chromobacterium violaceum TaxID=536 RepID=UPI001BEA4082|nr:hypothetical protein [Chromobacterium violaceum]MBT2867986.1 hypothetical protein [Chromobacterium violaceum]
MALPIMHYNREPACGRQFIQGKSCGLGRAGRLVSDEVGSTAMRVHAMSDGMRKTKISEGKRFLILAVSYWVFAIAWCWRATDGEWMYFMVFLQMAAMYFLPIMGALWMACSAISWLLSRHAGRSLD